MKPAGCYSPYDLNPLFVNRTLTRGVPGTWLGLGTVLALRSRLLSVLILLLLLSAFHAQVVVNFLHAKTGFGHVFRQTLLQPAINSSRQRHLAIVDVDGDVAGVNLPVLLQPFIHIFNDAVVRASVTARPAPGVRP